ncbi:MAG: hypothetical protein PHO66_05180 [Eubacteriales bacterium]|nr:hypothetical protein [Eubacteriales bacterium]
MLQDGIRQLVAYQQQASFTLSDLIWLLCLAILAIFLTKVAARVIKFLLVLAMAAMVVGFLFSTGILPMSLLGGA